MLAVKVLGLQQIISSSQSENLNYILTWETGAYIHKGNIAERQSVSVKMIMMRLELFLLITMVISTATKPLIKASGRNKLLLISFDGFRWDYDQDVDTPNLDKLVEDGVKAKYITPPMLTMTGPSHFTTITGNTHLVHYKNNNLSYFDNYYNKYYYGTTRCSKDVKYNTAKLLLHVRVYRKCYV